METLKDKKNRLPNGWCWAKLGEVSEVIAGQSPPGSTYRTIPEGLPFFQGKTDFGLLNPVPRVWCVEPNKIALPGDILISVRAPVGPTNVANIKCCIGRGLAAIRCKDNVDREFILSALRRYENKLVVKGTGSTFQAISRNDIEQLSIPLPPLDEQRRITGVLREQMAAVEKARVASQVRLEAIKSLPASILNQTFSQPVGNGWKHTIMPLGICGKIVSGVTLGRRLEGEGIIQVPYLRVANVKDGYLDLEDVATTLATASEVEALTLKEGDLLLTEGGDADKLGRGTVWGNQIPLCIHQNHIFRVRLDKTLLVPEFVAAEIGSPYGKAYFLRHAKQTTGIATINQKVLKAFPLKVPPIEVQKQIALALNKEMEIADKVRKAAEEELATINAMPAAFLRQAFNGKI